LKDNELPFFSEKIGKYIMNQNVYNVHNVHNESLGWMNRTSYNARDKRRIEAELPQYIIDQENHHNAISLLESTLSQNNPTLTADSEWYEHRSKRIKVNNIGVIYYIKKKTGEKSWSHPYTGKTNLPDDYLTSIDADL
jgi:hypothetical protein